MSTSEGNEQGKERRRREFPVNIDGSIVAHWLPIIGPTGLSIYMLLVYMGGTKIAGCFPGVRFLDDFLKAGRGCIGAYCNLLEICGLIRIQRGNRLESNRYFIVQPVPRASEQALKHVMETSIEKSNKKKLPAWIVRAIDKRCRRWQPIQKLYRRR